MSCPYPGCTGEPKSASDECPVCHRRIAGCPACGQPNRALARLCRACGSQLAVTAEWPLYRNNSTFASFSPAPLDFDSVSHARQFDRLFSPVGLGAEVVTPPITEHGLLIVCSRKGILFVLNRFTGERLADLRVGEGECFALVSGYMLVAAAGNRIVGCNLRDSFRNWSSGPFKLVERWRQTLDSGSIQHPLNKVGEDSLLVCTGGPDWGAVHCYHIETGEPRWEAPAQIPAAISAAVTDKSGSAYVLAVDRKVYRIASATGEFEPSRPSLEPLRVEVAPAWLDSTLFFFDQEGALCSCRTDTGEAMVPARVSELMLLGIKGFGVSPRGILVSHARGLTRLSLSGQLIWPSDPSMTAMSSSPVLAGDCGFGVGQDRSVVYMCDFKGTFLRFYQFLLGEDRNLAPPAFAGNVLYTCSLHGELNALRVNTSTNV